MKMTLRYWLIRTAWRATQPGNRVLMYWLAGWLLVTAALMAIAGLIA